MTASPPITAHLEPELTGQPSWLSSLATLQEYCPLTMLSSQFWLMWH